MDRHDEVTGKLNQMTAFVLVFGFGSIAVAIGLDLIGVDKIGGYEPAIVLVVPVLLFVELWLLYHLLGVKKIVA